MTVRVLIVDDEPLARRRIRRLLRAHPDMEVVAECDNGEAARDQALREAPDLIMVDVQMPGLDGFALLEALGTAVPRAVIFTTAYDEYAVRAFEVNALDYLVKPFSRARFDAALERARALLRQPAVGDMPQRAGAVLRELVSRQPITRLLVRRNARTIVVDTADVNWVEADRNLVRLHTRSGTFTIPEAISQLEERLDPATFVRVHRSAIVNVERILEIEPWFHGDAVLILRDGSRVKLSRSHRSKLSTLLGQSI